MNQPTQIGVLAPRFPGKAIGSLMRHAMATVPYYRARFKPLRTEDRIDYKTFVGLSRLKKHHLQSSRGLQEFLSKDVPQSQLVFEWTSGSSGRPMLCAKSAEERLRAAWCAWRVRRWWDDSILGKPGAAIGATWRGQTHTHRGELRLSVNNITPKTLDYYGRRLRSFKPVWMYGIPSSIYRLALHLQDHPLKAAAKSLRLIELQGEYLPTEYQEVIRRVFACGVANQYACHELWVLAYSCPNGSMHVLEDEVFIEILDELGQPVQDGQVGQVVVTGLHQRAMPFIRYELGDRARFLPESCGCGRTWRRLELTGCRQAQIFVTADGRQFDALFFIQTLQATNLAPLHFILRMYQIVQKSHQLIQLYYEPGPLFDVHGYQLFQAFENKVRAHVDSALQVNFLKHRQLGGRGKWNCFISEETRK